MISVRHHGSFTKTEKFLTKTLHLNFLIDNILHKYGQQGVEALAAATPVDSGLTANSWTYTIENTATGCRIVWENTNLGDGWFNIALSLNYGHGTGTGGYVEGIEYIDPALHDVFRHLADDAWKEVTNA